MNLKRNRLETDPNKIRRMKTVKKLRRIRSLARLKEKRLKSLSLQVIEIEEEFHKNKFEELKAEITAISKSEEAFVEEIIKTNNTMLIEKPARGDVLLFIRAIASLLQGDSPYRRKYGLESRFFGNILQSKQDYSQALNEGSTRDAHRIYDNYLKPAYDAFMVEEFGLQITGDLCVKIKTASKEIIGKIKGLKHPSKTLQEKKEIWADKNESHDNKEKSAKSLIEADSRNNKEIMGIIMRANEEEIEAAKELEEHFKHYAEKAQIMVAKMQKMESQDSLKVA